MSYWTFLRKQLPWVVTGFVLILVVSEEPFSERAVAAGLILMGGAALMACWDYRDAVRENERAS